MNQLFAAIAKYCGLEHILLLCNQSKTMRILHVTSFSPLATFNTPEETSIASNAMCKKFLDNVSFDVSQYFGKTISELIYSQRLISLHFGEDDYLNIVLNDSNEIELTRTSSEFSVQNMDDTFCIIYPSGRKEIWNSLSFLESYRAKVFENIYYMDNRIYLYFKDCEYLISVSILNIAEHPYKILRMCESD